MEIDWDWYRNYSRGDDVMSLMKNGTIVEAVYAWKAFLIGEWYV